MPAPNTSLAAVLAPQMLGQATARAASQSNSNRLGRRIVANYEAAAIKTTRLKCFQTSYARVREAAIQERIPLPALESPVFGRLWASYIIPLSSWLTLPGIYRGLGAPGALASMGLGKLVDTAGVWSGKLQPGAVMQTWWTQADFDAVRAGRPAKIGHSFIFLSYEYSGSVITALNIADQGYQSKTPLERKWWGVWIGANHTSGEPTFVA